MFARGMTPARAERIFSRTCRPVSPKSSAGSAQMASRVDRGHSKGGIVMNNRQAQNLPEAKTTTCVVGETATSPAQAGERNRS